jgi:hypothetical protein
LFGAAARNGTPIAGSASRMRDHDPDACRNGRRHDEHHDKRLGTRFGTCLDLILRDAILQTAVQDERRPSSPIKPAPDIPT